MKPTSQPIPAENRKRADAWLARAYGYAQRDHALWETQMHRAGNTGLARYFDIGQGPVPEMEDDSTYYADVIRWLLAHPNIHTDYLVEGPDEPNQVQQARLTRVSCDPKLVPACGRAHFQGHWLSRDFYVGDRAMRESGFDPSNRFGPFSGSTHHYAPVCLNSLLYKYELDLAWMAARLGKPGAQWKQRAATTARRDEPLPLERQRRACTSITTSPSTSFPITSTSRLSIPCGPASPTRSRLRRVGDHLSLLEQPGGIAMSASNTGLQWDLPFGWAPTSWVAIHGLDRAGFHEDARRISQKFSHTIEENFERDKTIREKYNVVSSSSDVQVATGYKMNVVGFGWTNAVYLEMQHLLEDGAAQSAKAEQ